MILAKAFMQRYPHLGLDMAALMTQLDKEPSVCDVDQDWNAGLTTWYFEDGSKIQIDGPEFYILYKPTTKESKVQL